MNTSYPRALRPCKCGAPPVFVHGQMAGVFTLQLTCLRCNEPCGALLMYTKPEDKARMAQAGVDGWNMAT